MNDTIKLSLEVLGDITGPEYEHFVDELATLDDDGLRNKHVYACFGVTFSISQELEVTLTNIAILHERLNGRIVDKRTADDFDTLFSRRTMGNMLRDIRNRVTWDDSVERLVRDALERRNRLAHGFFFDRAIQLMSDSGRTEVLRELAETASVLRRADCVLGTAVAVAMRSLGITEEQLEREYQEMLRRASEAK